VYGACQDLTLKLVAAIVARPDDVHMNHKAGISEARSLLLPGSILTVACSAAALAVAQSQAMAAPPSQESSVIEVVPLVKAAPVVGAVLHVKAERVVKVAHPITTYTTAKCGKQKNGSYTRLRWVGGKIIPWLAPCRMGERSISPHGVSLPGPQGLSR
jgi:hypothetical protein